MSTLEWKIAEVEYSPPHALRLNALPGHTGVTTRVPLAFDGPIKQPIREPRRVATKALCGYRCLEGHGMRGGMMRHPVRWLQEVCGVSLPVVETPHLVMKSITQPEVLSLGGSFDTMANSSCNDDASQPTYFTALCQRFHLSQHCFYSNLCWLLMTIICIGLILKTDTNFLLTTSIKMSEGDAVKLRPICVICTLCVCKYSYVSWQNIY